jgi:hypothetical protein
MYHNVISNDRRDGSKKHSNIWAISSEASHREERSTTNDISNQEFWPMVKRLGSSELKGAIVGMLLGDASLQHIGRKSRLVMSHSEKQKEYLLFKKDIVTQITGSDPIVYPKDTYLKITNKTYSGLAMQTKSLSYFEKLRKIFYDGQRKQVTELILKRLTILGLAIWYMDDGYLSIQMKRSRKNFHGGERYVYDEPKISSRKIKLATHCFSNDEQEIIQRYLINVWGIRTNIYKPEPIKNPEQRALYMNATNANKFIEIIKPYMLLPLFNKKIDMKYNGNRSKNEDIVYSYAKA